MPQELLQKIQSQLGEIREGVSELPAGTDLSALSYGIKKASDMIQIPKPQDPIPTSSLEGERAIKDEAPISDRLTSAVSDVMAGTSGIEGFYTALTEQMRADTLARETARIERDSAREDAKEFMESRPDLEEREDAARIAFLKRFNLPEDWEQEQMNEFLQMQTEIKDARGRLDALNLREQQELLNIERKMPGGLKSIARGEQSYVQRQYAIERAGIAAELSSKAALAEMYSGNMDMADRYINDYIAAATYDLQQKEESIMWFKDAYEQEYNLLDVEIKNAINSVLSFTQQEKEEKRQDLQSKMDLIRRAAENGINLNLSSTQLEKLSLEEVNDIYSKRALTAAQESMAQGSVYSEPSMDLMAGLLNIDDASLAQRQKINQDIRRLGLQSDEPQPWFKEEQERLIGEELSLAELQELWSAQQEVFGIYPEISFEEMVSTAITNYKEKYGEDRDASEKRIVNYLLEQEGYKPAEIAKYELGFNDLPRRYQEVVVAGMNNVFGEKKRFVGGLVGRLLGAK